MKKQFGIENFNVYLTLKKEDNAYTRWLYRRWGKNSSNIQFVGFLDKKSLYEYYGMCDCLIFPSKIETWGLPVTEFSAFGKPMLLADLPYAHETASGCDEVAFFDPDKPFDLAIRMKQLISGDKTLLRKVEQQEITNPKACSWDELFNILLK